MENEYKTREECAVINIIAPKKDFYLYLGDTYKAMVKRLNSAGKYDSHNTIYTGKLTGVHLVQNLGIVITLSNNGGKNEFEVKNLDSIVGV